MSKYLPGVLLIQKIVEEIFPEEYKELLKLEMGKTTVTLEQQLMNRYGAMGVKAPLEYAVEKAIVIIKRNEHNLLKLKHFDDIVQSYVYDPSQFAKFTSSNPNIIQVIDEYKGVTTSQKSKSLNSARNKSGASDSSEETMITDEGNTADNKFINDAIKDGFSPDLAISAEKDITGKVSTSISRSSPEDAPLSVNSDLSEEVAEQLHVHSINVDVNRVYSRNNLSSSSVSGTNKSGTTKGKTETFEIIKSEAFRKYMKFQVLDIRTRFIQQFKVLFTEKRYI